MFSAVQNVPIIVNLIEQSRNNGWSVNSDDNTASHENCNSGYIPLLTYPLITGRAYQISYSVLTITNGTVQPFMGTQAGVSRTTPGLYVETITAAGSNPEFKFYSNGNCQIQAFNIRDTVVNTDLKQQNTICFSVRAQKWSDFRTIEPDYGFSLFTKSFTLFNGDLYGQVNQNSNRNNFYGVQYQSIIKFTTNQQPTITKRYNSLNYQANQLLVAPSGSITTENGQVSELLANDFLQQRLDDGVNPIVLDYQIEGLYQGNFLRDSNYDLINGPILIGNYMTVELYTTSPSVPLKIFTTEIIYIHSAQGIR
jgi:hypothetical protein